MAKKGGNMVGRLKRRVSVFLNSIGIDPLYLYYILGIGPATIPKEIKYRLFGPPDSLPLPPRKLKFLVAGSPWSDHFLELGKECIREITRYLADSGVEISSFNSILDFGCGCGRVTRHLAALEKPTIYGTDYNPLLISWCRQNLVFAQFDTNDLAPPLKYADNSMGFIFAGSVFTHLDEDLQKAWITELRRVLAPGGFLYFTTAGEQYLYKLDREQLRSFRSDELVMVNEESVGRNICLAVEPRRFVEKNLAEGFEIIKHIPDGARGFGHQDVYIMKKIQVPEKV